MDFIRRAFAACLGLFLTGISTFTLAQNYPTKPVTLIVPFAAGGSTDMIARVMARALSQQSGQQFLVENVGGAGATIGTGKVAASQPDGYTLLLGGASALVIAPHLFSNLKYDPFTSFEPIGKIATSSYVLVTKSDSNFQTYEQLVAHAKKNPGKLNYGSPGEGSSLHLTIELMKERSKFAATHIPFRGSAPAWTALLAGDVDFIIDSPSGAMPMIKSGKVRPLAVTSLARDSELPDVPTLNEKGLENFDSQAWFAMVAPKGTPASIVSTLQQFVARSLVDPEVQATLKNAGFIPFTSQEPGALASAIRLEYDRWGSTIKANQIKLQ
jgi:tripartite-type tricarboxylate transporter receptor subunit TctC